MNQNVNMSTDLSQLLNMDIPDTIKQLGMNYENLKQVADYCESNYNEEEDKKTAFCSTMNYAIHSLACVASQIGMAAEKFLQFLELENGSLHKVESTINELSTLVTFHEQKVSRRSIANILTRKDIVPLQPNSKGGIVMPTKSPKKIEYIRNPVDYTLLDNIGHGAKSHNKSSSTISHHAYNYGTYRAPNNNYRHTAAGSQPSTYATISHASNFSHYRVTGQIHGNQSNYKSVQPPTAPTYSTIKNSKRNTTLGVSLMQGKRSSSLDDSQHKRLSYARDRSHSLVPDIGQFKFSQTNWRQSAAPTEDPPPPPPSLAGLWSNQPPVNYFPDITDDSLPPPPSPMFLANNTGMDFEQHSQNYEDIPSISDLPEVRADYNDNQGLYQTTGVYMMRQPQQPEHFIEKVIAVYDYTANEPDELTFQENSVIYVIQKHENGWWDGIVNDERGLFPSNYVEPCV